MQCASGRPFAVFGGDQFSIAADYRLFATVEPGVENEGTGQIHRLERRGTSFQSAKSGEQ
jgi:hypothetical protein